MKTTHLNLTTRLIPLPSHMLSIIAFLRIRDRHGIPIFTDIRADVDDAAFAFGRNGLAFRGDEGSPQS